MYCGGDDLQRSFLKEKQLEPTKDKVSFYHVFGAILAIMNFQLLDLGKLNF